MQKKRVMVVSSEVWPLAARVSLALSKIGFQLAAVSVIGSPIRQVRSQLTHFTYWPWAGARSIQRAIKVWSPDFLVCTDDRSVRQLHDIHLRATTAPSEANSSVVNLIEASLGDPTSHAPALAKSKLILFAQTAGVRCPNTIVIPNGATASREFAKLKYPILVKADDTYGGMGVCLSQNEDEARAAVRDLANPMHRLIKSNPFFDQKFLSTLLRPIPVRHRVLCLQEYIVGRPANRAVVCWRGEILAGVSVEAIETIQEFGPASVVRVVDHPEMAEAARILVSRLKLSGFIGFDFMLDFENKAWLIEMNPRATPISHIPFKDGANLPAALYSRLTGDNADSSRIIEEEKIVLFPQELMRLRQSPYLGYSVHPHYHDVPWDEPGLVSACIKYASKSSLRKQLSERYSRP
jgi:glutathione synthase/RimK-type ligase-like ATP-grasp enzyme